MKGGEGYGKCNGLSQHGLSGEHMPELMSSVLWQCPEPEGSRLEERRTILTAVCTR